MLKKSISMVLVLLVAFSLALPVFAQEGGMEFETQTGEVARSNVAVPEGLPEVTDEPAATLSAEESEALAAQAADGWVTSGGYTYYYENGVMATNWRDIGGNRYFFHSTAGYMLTGGWKINGVPYFFDRESGVLGYGWVYDSQEGDWYYADGSGALQDGWQNLGGNYYYFNSYAMLTDFWEIGDAEYYFGQDGAMRVGWFVYNNGEADFWMYAAPSGAITYGWSVIDGSWYFFDKYAFMVTGGNTINGVDYIFNPNGAMSIGWTVYGDHWYFATDGGALAKGWALIDGVWYYFAGEFQGYNYHGLMLHDGIYEINGKLYAFDMSGGMVTGWYLLDGTWFYIFESGVMAQSEWVVDADGNYFYFFEDGAMAKGEVEVPGYGVCIFSESGVFLGYKEG